MRVFVFVCFSVLLVSCGGGGSSTVGVATNGGDLSSGASVPACLPFTDYAGREVSCAEMNLLAGANLPYENGAGSGDGAGDGGADGTAGDGLPIANAELQFTDINGKSVSTKANSLGYFRINLRGLKAPIVATVMRSNNPWKSMLVGTIVKAPANRKFYTINLTSLTDVVASEVAKLDGNSGSSSLTAAMVLRQETRITGIISNLNNSINSQIIAVGLNPATFNPLTTPYTAVFSDSYDKLLESIVVTKDSTTGTVSAAPKALSLVGSWVGSGDTTKLLTFFANGDFMMTQTAIVGDPVSLQAWPGVEHMTYSWNSSTGAFSATCPTVDTNGTAGISGNYTNGFTAYKGDPVGTCLGASESRTLTVNGNTLTVVSPSGTNVFTQVARTASSIVGSWVGTGGTTTVVTFFENGDLIQSQSAVTGDAVALQAWPGVEHTTYSWNSSTGALSTSCPTVDTNGTAGLSGNYTGGFSAYKGTPLGSCIGSGLPRTATISGNTMNVVTADGTFTLTRLAQ